MFKEFESSHQTFAIGGPGWLGIRLFAALITNTCSLVTRLLPMRRSLVTRLEYMYVFDHAIVHKDYSKSNQNVDDRILFGSIK